MSIEAMRQALEALDGLSEPYDVLKAQNALRAAIEQSEKQEPVAWVCYGSASDEKHTIDYRQEDIDAIPVGTMLYPTPRQWKGLTDEEADELIRRFARYELLRAIEAKLKERNT